MNSLGPKPARAGPTRAETCPRACARGNFANKALQFLNNPKEPKHYLTPSLTLCRNDLNVLFLYRARSPTAPSATELGELLDRPNGAETSALLWLKPNSCPN